MNPELTNTIVGYFSGLIIAVLLLVILWSLLKLDKKLALPRFCTNCVNFRYRLFRSPYCRMRCKYNPAYRYSYEKSYYQKRKG